MEILVNELASLRVAIVTGIASTEQIARAKELADTMPESAIEDAESRVDSVLPSVVAKPFLKIEVLIEGRTHTATGQIISNLVSSGGCWYPGVVVCGLDNEFLNETIAYAINEGGVIADCIEPSDQGGNIIPWRVSYVTSEVLDLLRRLDAMPPTGSVLTTEDGLRFIVTDEALITDGDLAYQSMTDLGVSFVLESHHGSV